MELNRHVSFSDSAKGGERIKKDMKETIAHILEVVVVVIALFAVIAIITMMTKVGNGERDSDKNLVGAGIITQQIDSTINKVFDKTTGAIENTSTFSSDDDSDEDAE
jgi:TctA family transporter